MLRNIGLSELGHFIIGFFPAVPAGSTPRRVSMKHANRVTAIIKVRNAGAGVTGSAITLHQAQNIAGLNEKALPFTRVTRNLDHGVATGDQFTSVAVANNTFTTDATVSKDLVYIIEIDPTFLDKDGGFDCVRVGIGNAAAATVGVDYFVHTNHRAYRVLVD